MISLQRRQAVFAALLMIATSRLDAAGPVSFSRDIRPILAANCFACHGPDPEDREAELRLDVRDVAVEKKAVVPGKPNESELIRRIVSDDDFERMPPADTGKALTDKQKELLKRWIENGANYEAHWAFVPPQRPVPPEVGGHDGRPRNAIDRFVLARLREEGLAPSPEADRYTLVRRVYLDLIGLPPTPEQADAFVSDDDPAAYDKLVDRLLDSEHYGERWARLWLDLARYSDTNGYEKDRPRSIWKYRDWVIDALNRDLPYDEFTIEQIAGDMLPDATQSQLIATGFHRNTMLNEEGGIDPLEYRFYAMVDRVATTGTVWLGLTTGCAQCHSHKYDPITHTDYYSLMALMNNADEPDLQVKDESIERRREAIRRQIAKLEADLPEQFPPDDGEGTDAERRQRNLEQKYAAWLDDQRQQAVRWTVLTPTKMKTNLPRLEVLPDGSIFSTGDITKRDVFDLSFNLSGIKAPITALRLEVLPDERLPAGGPGRAFYEGRKGDFFLSELTAKAGDGPLKFANASHSYGKISIGSGNADAANVYDGDGSTGWSTAGAEGTPNQLVVNLAKPIPPSGTLDIEMLFERHFAASLGRFRISATTAEGDVKATALPVDLESVLTRDAATWTAEERRELKRYYLNVAPELAEARKKIEQLRKQMPDYPVTMIFRERPADNPRATHRHHRGEYLSPKEEVPPRLPEMFLSGDETGPQNRLEFARWLVSRKNPLAARVAVNRAWRAFFGAGLMRTSGDFGTQSDPPTHPQLLDWLACEFVDSGWSQKELHRLIVTSATYRQSSRISPDLLKRDPQNRLLARGPRYRVDAEMVRDIMLAASGVLSNKMYGPGVYPPQPASVTALAYGNTPWKPSTGEDRYRRSLYTFSKRTAPFAAYTVFDAPTGETCLARRDRSDTPLQALTLLNDDMFLELARAAVEHVAKQHTNGSKEQIATALFRRFLTRPPTERELGALIHFFDSQLARLKAGELNAEKIVGKEKAANESAAWTMVARAVMNLDEVIVKQ